jgi:hypothetical protein
MKQVPLVDAVFHQHVVPKTIDCGLSTHITHITHTPNSGQTSVGSRCWLRTRLSLGSHLRLLGWRIVR